MKHIKNLAVIFSTIIWSISFTLNCDNNSVTECDNLSNQIINAHAIYQQNYWDNLNHSSVDSINVNLHGYIYANILPSFNYFILGKEKYEGDKFSMYIDGSIFFSTFNRHIKDSYNPLYLEVSTSIGTVKGIISLPDLIDSVIINIEDTLRINESFTIGWMETNADFYSVNFDYLWLDENFYTTKGCRIDSFVIGDSVTFNGSFFPNDGQISHIFIIPINGPYPEINSAANMDGEGSGFLYYYGKHFYYEKQIIVGSGLRRRSYLGANSFDETNTYHNLIHKIECYLSGNRNVISNLPTKELMSNGKAKLQRNF